MRDGLVPGKPASKKTHEVTESSVHLRGALDFAPCGFRAFQRSLAQLVPPQAQSVPIIPLNTQARPNLPMGHGQASDLRGESMIENTVEASALTTEACGPVDVMKCLACGSDKLALVFELGAQPAANLLLEHQGAQFERVDLALMHCPQCGHLQQRTFFPSEKLFSHYLYSSGTSRTLAQFFGWLATSLKRWLPEGARVLELASNDGSFLDALRSEGFHVRGIDPARNLVDLCRQRGLDVECDFWPTTNERGPYDAVVALNVLAHNPRPMDFLKGAAEVLAERGILVLQVSQADMVCNGEFDTLYHEHYSFFCLGSLTALLHSVGLQLLTHTKTTVHGGSLLMVCCRAGTSFGGNVPCFEGAFVDVNQRLLRQPGKLDLAIFVDKARRAAAETLRLVQLARRSGHQICLVGVAAKAVTFLQFSGLSVDAVFDEAPLKLGRYIPGMHLAVRPLQDISQIQGAALFIVGAWNFYQEIKDKLAHLRVGRSQDRLLRYFPDVLEEPLFP